MKYGVVPVALVVAACASHAPAPVVDRTAPPRETAVIQAAVAVPVTGEGGTTYTVKKGDTLYSIALEHGRDHKDIAAWNNLDNPNRIEIGRQLRVSPPGAEEAVAVTKPVVTSAPVTTSAPVATSTPMTSPTAEPRPAGANTDAFKLEPKGGKVAYSDEALARMRETGQPAAAPTTMEKPDAKPAAAEGGSAPRAATGDDAIDWAWPAPGSVLQTYTGGGGAKEINRGVDIAGKPGESVLAAAGGTVTYVGSGIPGYGNFLIVRHNPTYLSVYANNNRILVKEHQTVTKGQKIAEIGGVDADQAKLHFEIRRFGKPVDPLNYLPAR